MASARVAVVRLDEMDRTRTSSHTDGYLELIAGRAPWRGTCCWTG